ncbi:serine/threonine protein kinase [Fonticula alba]|uniref:Serine/threonine protein kinase n=1 Tax=Fonticula alba TaxID=691883 RepID=A0A058YZW2_FONAL|nr:serine/threonine protein kinase [Fonticula alba]KCV67411.1 serine/threonine protein kinase [Fonticula alba]|eukprot:XP_009498187.1 serine/threonine protein kinase [Fonticula alba]
MVAQHTGRRLRALAPLSSPLPALLPLLPLLLLALLGLARGQDVFLHAAPHEALGASGPAAFVTGPGEPSVAVTHPSRDLVVGHMQNVDLHAASEVRWGAFFGLLTHGLSCPRPGGLADAQLMCLPLGGSPGIVAVEHTTTAVAIFTSPEEHRLPGPGTELLAGVGVSATTVDLLGLTGSPSEPERSIYLATLGPAGLQPVRGNFFPVSGPAFAIPGPGRSFFLSGGRRFVHLILDGLGGAQSSGSSLSASIVSMAATRVVSSAATCPEHMDLVLLLDNKLVFVYHCQGLSERAGLSTAILPSGSLADGARLLAPSALAMDDSPGPLYLVTPGSADPADRLWLAHIQGDTFTWRRVVLPPAVTDLTDLRLVRLQRSPSDSMRWTLVAGRTVLFPSDDFRCQDDHTIVCDAAGGSSGAPAGWTCAPGHAASPFVSPDHLCAGCASGWYLSKPAEEAPFSRPGHSCRICPQANCRTCTAEHCLVCSAGFNPLAGVCRPAGMPSPDVYSTVPVGEPLPGLGPGDRVTAIGATRLAPEPGTGSPVLPAADSALVTGMLLFTEHRKSYFLPAADITRPGKAPPEPISLFDGALPVPVVSVAEVGPLQRDGGLLHVVLLCGQDQVLRHVWLSCAGPGPCAATGAGLLDTLPSSQCSGVRRLDPRRFLVYDGPRRLSIIWVSGSSKHLAWFSIEGLDAVSLLEATGPRADPGLGDWLVWAGLGPGATAGPDFLPGSADPRQLALDGRFLGDAPPAGGMGLVPVLLSRGASTLPPELVFSRVSGPEWLVLRAPGDMRPAGRSVDVPTGRQSLGAFPGALAGPGPRGLGVLLQGLSLAHGGLEYPSALVLLADTFIGLSLLHCPGAGGPEPCALQAGLFFDLPPGLRLPSGAGPWSLAPLPVVGGSGGSGQRSVLQPGHMLTLLAFAPGPGLVTFSLALPCPAGWHGLACDPCDSGCATCDGPGPGACTSCGPGTWLHHRACLGACPMGTWSDAGAGACRDCPAACGSCASATECMSCSAGHFLLAGSCLPCDGSCAECRDASSCTVCRPGLVFLGPDEQAGSLCGGACLPGEYIGDGRCAECDHSCELCTGQATSCQVCAAGFRWVSRPAAGGAGACVPCDPGCASCTATRCLACEQPLFLTPAGACVSSCPAGSWPNGESCQPCDVSCVACVGGAADQCTRCAAGLDFIEAGPGVGACVSGCPEGQYRDAASSLCVPCDPACATCNGPSDRHCWRCLRGVLQDGDCVQDCAARHVALGGRCLPCHASCGACVGVRSTECTMCMGDLLALPAGRAPFRCVPACPASYGPSAGGCAACPGHCVGCPASSTVCAQCERGWLLDSPACVAHCPSGTSAQGALFIACHGSCNGCFGQMADQCLGCRPEAPLLVGGACHAVCPAGTFPQGQSCIPCSDTCASCSGPAPSQCTACARGRALFGGACLLGCPAGLFAEDGVCTACEASCATCASGDACASCWAWGLHGPAGLCVQSCPTGWHQCTASDRCLSCPARCAACVSADATCAAHCTQCEEGFVLSAGACHDRCPDGEFAAPGSGVCQPCGPGCRACSGSGDFCTGCEGGLLRPAEGLCASACVGASAPVDGVCLDCLAGCERCDPGPGQAGCTATGAGTLDCPTIATCSRCVAGRLLLGGTACVETCPGGYFADVDGNPGVCGACHESCAHGCTGPEKGDCERDSRRGASRIGLAVGLAVGLLLLLILLILLVLFLVRRRKKLPPQRSPADGEDATMLNTIVELALPGAILVDVGVDFRPLDEALGCGTQASVVAAQAVGAGVAARLGCPGIVAIKSMKTDSMKPLHVAMFQNEVALMWLLREHGHIVRLFGYSEQPPAIVMERFDCDLGALLHSEVPLTPVQLADIAQQWAAGLEAMHAHGIAHCDLKPGNVFVLQTASCWRAALGDLGTSRNLSADRSSALVLAMPELNALTVPYAAPEVITAFQRGTTLDRGCFLPSDIYAAAIMLHECLTRAVPWPGLGIHDIMAAVIGGARPGAGTMAASATDLVQAAWQEDPGRRPSAATFRQRCMALFVASGGLGDF